MTVEANLEPSIDVSDATEADVQTEDVSIDEPEVDAEEAEYQAAMAKIREESEKKESDDQPEDEPKEKADEQPKEEEKESDSKTWKLKINGQEVEFDASSEDTQLTTSSKRQRRFRSKRKYSYRDLNKILSQYSLTHL